MDYNWSKELKNYHSEIFVDETYKKSSYQVTKDQGRNNL